jgi:hypothetical protein
MAVVCTPSFYYILQKQQKQVHVVLVFYVQKNEMFGLKLVFFCPCMHDTFFKKCSSDFRHLKVHLCLRVQPNAKYVELIYIYTLGN